MLVDGVPRYLSHDKPGLDFYCGHCGHSFPMHEVPRRVCHCAVAGYFCPCPGFESVREVMEETRPRKIEIAHPS